MAKDQLLFQKLECSEPEVFQNYISIKQMAAELFPDDRNAYREMKGWFIGAVLAAARSAGRENAVDDRIKYWIYEVEMSDEANQRLTKQLKRCEMTLDEYADAVLRHMIDNPEETRRLYVEMGVGADESSEIRLIRFYPVYKGETEAQAKRRKLAEEAAEAGDSVSTHHLT